MNIIWELIKKIFVFGAAFLLILFWIVKSIYLHATATDAKVVKDVSYKNYNDWPFKSQSVTLSCKMLRIKANAEQDGNGPYWRVIETSVRENNQYHVISYYKGASSYVSINGETSSYTTVGISSLKEDLLSYGWDGETRQHYLSSPPAIIQLYATLKAPSSEVDKLLSEWINLADKEKNKIDKGYVPDDSISWEKYLKINYAPYEKELARAQEIAATLCSEEAKTNKNFIGTERWPYDNIR
jgi:hypothetical protein